MQRWLLAEAPAFAALLASHAPPAAPPAATPDATPAVSVRNLSWGYKPGSPPQLCDLTFDLPAGARCLLSCSLLYPVRCKDAKVPGGASALAFRLPKYPAEHAFYLAFVY